MVNENWVKTDVLTDWQKRAKKFVEERKKWEQDQIKQGKKEVKIPHPTLKKTFIIKYI
jgi:hypothetical protein